MNTRLEVQQSHTSLVIRKLVVMQSLLSEGNGFVERRD
jgi:hypothetical protein